MNGQTSFRVRSDFAAELNAITDGVKVYSYIYDAGSEGGSGMNRYGELVLSGRDG